jgi:aspartate kinase
VALCVDRDDLATAQEIVDRIAPELEAGKVIVQPRAAIVSIFGPDFRERPGIAGTMFKALAARGINILAISTSISTVSCVIHADDLEAALISLRETFDLP